LKSIIGKYKMKNQFLILFIFIESVVRKTITNLY
jgi:hypothetical protein